MELTRIIYICRNYPRDAILDSGASMSVVGQLQFKGVHYVVRNNWYWILGMQEHHLLIIGVVYSNIKSGESVFSNPFGFQVMDENMQDA